MTLSDWTGSIFILPPLNLPVNLTPYNEISLKSLSPNPLQRTRIDHPVPQIIYFLMKYVMIFKQMKGTVEGSLKHE